jgi:hypothetical protein
VFSNSCCGNDHNIILFYFLGLNSCRVKPLGWEILKIEGMVTQSCLPFWDCSPGCKLSPIVEMLMWYDVRLHNHVTWNIVNMYFACPSSYGLFCFMYIVWDPHVQSLHMCFLSLVWLNQGVYDHGNLVLISGLK